MIIIHRAVAHAVSQQAALRLVREVTHEVKTGAFRILMTGPYTTGRLALGLEDHVTPTADGARGEVGINGALHPYAASVEGGAKVHWIFPKGARGTIRFGAHEAPMLRFFWRKAGEVVFLPHIPGSPSTVGRSHPGQPGKSYLRKPLVIAAARHGMRVVLFEV